MVVAVVAVEAVEIAVTVFFPVFDVVMRKTLKVGIIGVNAVVIGISHPVAVNAVVAAMARSGGVVARLEVDAVISAIHLVADNIDAVADAGGSARNYIDTSLPTSGVGPLTCIFLPSISMLAPISTRYLTFWNLFS